MVVVGPRLLTPLLMVIMVVAVRRFFGIGGLGQIEEKVGGGHKNGAVVPECSSFTERVQLHAMELHLVGEDLIAKAFNWGDWNSSSRPPHLFPVLRRGPTTSLMMTMMVMGCNSQELTELGADVNRTGEEVNS